jgi:hypothetical protein
VKIPCAADEITVARTVAAVAQRVPGVAGLGWGVFAAIATYSAGQTIRGVAVTRNDDALTCDVHVIALYPDAVDLLELADRIRHAVQSALEESGESVRRIDIAVDDLVVRGRAQK